MASKMLLVGLAVQAIVPCYALWRGGAPERVTAVVLAGSILLSHFALPHRDRFQHWEMQISAIDTVVLVTALTIAIYANRFWTIPFAAFQTIIAIGHLAKWTNGLIMPTVYYSATSYMIYPLMALLAIGTWRHHSRQRTQATDASWKRSLHLWTRGLPRFGLSNS